MLFLLINKTDAVIIGSNNAFAGGNMTVFKKEQKQQFKNVLLRVSIPAPLMSDLKKIKKLCNDNGFYFDIKPDVIVALEKAVEEAKELLNSEMKNKFNH